MNPLPTRENWRFVKPEEKNDGLPMKEKAELHLKTWSKRKLIEYALNAASMARLELWASEA